MSNLDKISEELDKLIADAMLLRAGMSEELGDLTKELRERLAGDPLDFRTHYEQWYSKAKQVVAQLLPGRSADFTALYEKPKNRKEVEYDNYTISDYMANITNFSVDTSAAIPRYDQQMTMLWAVRDRLDSSLFDIKQILQADLFDSELDAAQHLNRNGFNRAAGALVGVVIESHLQQVCENHSIKITKKDPTINDLNQSLKDNDVIDTPQWRKIQHLGDLRNLCDHKKSKDPTKDQIDELIEGTDKLIKTVF